ncbi:MAG: hypothetical protein FJX65_16590 [Alphaproteobacteria bacterium]|nr:hypothetical protein [Alphaproteobacteria bacterium]
MQKPTLPRMKHDRPQPEAVVPLKQVTSPANGTLGIVESGRDVPFEIRQVLYQYAMPANARRGGHARYTAEELIICIQGQLHVALESASGLREHTLTSADRGIYVPPLTWVRLTTQSSDVVTVLLLSRPYDEADYIRDYATFRATIERL